MRGVGVSVEGDGVMIVGLFLEAGRGDNFEHFGGGVGSELLLRQFFSFFPLFFLFFLKQLNCASTSDILYIYGR